MYDPFIYHLWRAYPATTRADRPFFALSNRLYSTDGNHERFFVHPQFSLACQQHDGDDTYLTVLEVHAHCQLAFVLGCTYNDLHGCYVKEGQVFIQYALVYAPKGEYDVRIAPGVVKPNLIENF